MPDSLLNIDKDFENLYKRNYKFVYRICFTYMKNQFEAEDCTEDTFVKLLKGKYTFENVEHEKKWLTIVAINVCKDKLKHWWRKVTVSLDESEQISCETCYKFDESIDVILKLPNKYKDVIYLYYYMDYQTDEIAAILKKPSSTVRNHLCEARQLLKNKLGGELNER